MQQALEYAECLDLPFAYSSNGDAFLEHDRTASSGTVVREIGLGQFPSPDDLWAHRDVAGKPRIAAAIDLAHSAGAKNAGDLIRADPRAWSEGHEAAQL